MQTGEIVVLIVLISLLLAFFVTGRGIARRSRRPTVAPSKPADSSIRFSTLVLMALLPLLLPLLPFAVMIGFIAMSIMAFEDGDWLFPVRAAWDLLIGLVVFVSLMPWVPAAAAALVVVLRGIQWWRKRRAVERTDLS